MVKWYTQRIQNSPTAGSNPAKSKFNCKHDPNANEVKSYR